MSKKSGYSFFEAGKAVAAAHLGLTIRRVSGNPALAPSDIVLPRNQPKARLILWLTAIAAESKGAGQSDPLRRMRNRQRVRTHMQELMTDLAGSTARRQATANRLRAQAQDRANAICADLYPAIQKLADRIDRNGEVTGAEVSAIVQDVKANRNGKKLQ